jgi:hypothetical protein
MPGAHREYLVDILIGTQNVNWQIGDFALCITPGSKLENRVVMIVSKPCVLRSPRILIVLCGSLAAIKR